MLVRRFAVDGVYHYLAWRDLFDGLYPRQDVAVTGVVHGNSVVRSFHEHGLDDEMAVEGFQLFDDLLHVVCTRRTVDPTDIIGIHSVEFQDVVVNALQGSHHLRTVEHGRIAQHAHLGRREIAVAQGQRVIHDFRKMRVGGRFAVAGKSQHVRGRAVGFHVLQADFQCFAHLFAGRAAQVCTVVRIETAFTIDAIKRTHFTVSRHQIDAQGHSQSTAMYGTENGRRIDNRRHAFWRSFG